MGRSLVIDLEAAAGTNFRQVDHRTIQSIILRNVKYTLGKKSTLSTLEGVKRDEKAPKWEQSKLKLGNWFSENQFYRLDTTTGKQWDMTIKNHENGKYSVPIPQIYDMFSGTLFESTEKVTRTNMIELFTNAAETAFTVTFRRKVTPEDVQEVLQSIKSQKDLVKRQKELAQEVIEGKPITITGFLIKAEEKLGRSTIIDLSQDYNNGWRQVDHRTIEELIIKNVKYTLKK